MTLTLKRQSRIFFLENLELLLENKILLLLYINYQSLVSVNLKVNGKQSCKHTFKMRLQNLKALNFRVKILAQHQGTFHKL